ncbi:globin domain-containing protein [Kitasatospora sp. NPDC006786]|uniref:globin domain-containing protein n=1 Tax=unclassified Kitasatospora TaxID=2633591 RepID=UPI00340BC853
MKSRGTVLVRTGHGSAGAASVPGLPTGAPGRAPAREVAREVAVRPSTPLGPLDLPPLPPLPAAEAPTAVLPPVSLLEPVRPVIPARPPHPPAVPATGPATGPGPASGSGPASGFGAVLAPDPTSFRPLFADAPGLNWAGPGDRWTEAWGVRTPVGQLPAAPPAVALPAAGLPAVGLPAAGQDGTAGRPPLTGREVALVRAGLAAVGPDADRATAHFFALLFLRHPELRPSFPAAMDVHRDRLFRTLLAVVREIDQPVALRATLTGLGRDHRRYGTLTGYDAAVEECLVATLARYAGGHWDAEAESAWRRAYRMISSAVIEAAEEDARTSPPWWQGEIVRHERRTRDVAAITVRPDQAYPFRAGQYAALETPWWPRVWRQYSFAGAPRPDGLLTFHVKAVQAGWVSNALVHRAAPGDVLRLGPAAGSMTVDHAAGPDLLCLGGGTGIAPIRALVEEAVEHGVPGRRVEVFYGARRAEELYALGELRELAARNRWLTVRPVLSGGAPAGVLLPGGLLPGGPLTGELPEVVSRFGPWTGREAVLSGPAAMVRTGVGALLRAGVPAERIRHDPVGDPTAG